MFINISNQPNCEWDTYQYGKARTFGEIRDIPFPEVPATATGDEVKKMAEEVFINSGGLQILNTELDVILCQGESSLMWHIVNLFKNEGFKCVVPCYDEERATSNRTQFKFVQFREI